MPPSPLAVTLSHGTAIMMGDFMTFHSRQPLDMPVDSGRIAEQDRARAAGAARLQALGVRLHGTESGDDIATLLDAIDMFERAVENQGGDLMVDEGPHGRTTEPDDPDFVLPRRGGSESVDAFAARVSTAAQQLRLRPRR